MPDAPDFLVLIRRQLTGGRSPQDNRPDERESGQQSAVSRVRTGRGGQRLPTALKGGPMKSYSWEDLFRRHPIFSSLNEEEIMQLLTDETSQERDCPQGSVILRQGEFGDSVFLIGLGSVQVTLRGPGDQEIPLSTLKAGELFGEVAVLERKPRSATVTAREDCTLLEVRGEEFLKLLERHPDMQVKVRVTMSERLRQSSRQ
jgi:signal-transduction protein with cAMP-binding, CBS, and nucleotidyltransferase domain